MKNWGVYWTYFAAEREIWPVSYWRIGGGSRLIDVRKGDLLWLIASGKLCEMSGNKANKGYLVELFFVERVIPETLGRFKYAIEAMPKRAYAIDPPMSADEWFRPWGMDAGKPIGSIRQSPWVLEEHFVDALKKLLKKHDANLFSKIFEG